MASAEKVNIEHLLSMPYYGPPGFSTLAKLEGAKVAADTVIEMLSQPLSVQLADLQNQARAIQSLRKQSPESNFSSIVQPLGSAFRRVVHMKQTIERIREVTATGEFEFGPNPLASRIEIVTNFMPSSEVTRDTI